MLGDTIHWYLTDRCNLDCSYCFRPNFTEDSDDVFKLARLLAESGAKNIVLGGGEPTLERRLPEVTDILKSSGKNVVLHTNGLLLQGLLDRLNVDDIALPLDSLDYQTQSELRGKRFADFMHSIPELGREIKDRGMRLGYHTVFTDINRQDIPELHESIKANMDYWRIYEFNADLALSTALKATQEQSRLRDTFSTIKHLKGGGTPEKGYTDCLFAHFLLAEQQMDDPRVKFVGQRDTPIPYAFMDNRGDISSYTWLSGNKRRVIGNISEGYDKIVSYLTEIHEKDWELDDQTQDEFWVATVGDMPLWARLWDGSYFFEEIEEVSPDYLEKVAFLAKLHTRRTYGSEVYPHVSLDRHDIFLSL